MQEIRAELDDLSFKIIEPELRRSIIQRLKVLRLQDEELLEKTIKKIEELLMKNKVKAKIFGREKKPYSIWKKMKVKSVNFSQLSDIMAFTILTRRFRKLLSSTWSSSSNIQVCSRKI